MAVNAFPVFICRSGRYWLWTQGFFCPTLKLMSYALSYIYRHVSYEDALVWGTGMKKCEPSHISTVQRQGA